MVFATKLLEARLALNLSQQELAEKSGVAAKSISNYERGLTLPSTQILRKLAKALEVSVSYLIDDDVQDKHKDIEHDFFLAEVRERFGTRALSGARAVLADGLALHAGGTVSEEALQSFEQSLMQVFIDIKDEAQQKFTSRKRKSKKRTTD